MAALDEKDDHIVKETSWQLLRLSDMDLVGSLDDVLSQKYPDIVEQNAYRVRLWKAYRRAGFDTKRPADVYQKVLVQRNASKNMDAAEKTASYLYIGLTAVLTAAGLLAAFTHTAWLGLAAVAALGGSIVAKVWIRHWTSVAQKEVLDTTTILLDINRAIDDYRNWAMQVYAAGDFISSAQFKDFKEKTLRTGQVRREVLDHLQIEAPLNETLQGLAFRPFSSSGFLMPPVTPVR